MKRRAHDELVLAIFPTSRGLAYTFFESPLSPIDWGLKRIRQTDKNARSLEIVERLCHSLRPDTLVIEDCVLSKSRRSARVRNLYALIANFAAAENLTLACYPRKAVYTRFRQCGACTRHQIAQAIASYIPAFMHRMPPMRKLWQAEDQRLSLFDAAALALTHYAFVPEATEPP
jgi:Holliday junction resolvasome RuvABC endonuclease subunit